MKLRNKITLLCSIILLLTMLCVDSVILFLSAETISNDTRQSGLMQSYEAFTGFDNYLRDTAVVNDDGIKYYFKAGGDDYTVCFGSINRREYYNNTVFSYYQLADGDYKGASGDMSYKRMSYFERRLLVFRRESSDYTLFHIIDLKPSISKFTSMAALSVLASVVVTLISIFVISLLVRRSMRPLADLSFYASKIADGDYSRRIAIKGRDEVGQLGVEFNKMADAIEKRTGELEVEIEKRQLFMGNLTHELKTPLTAISGYAQTMQRTVLSEEEQGWALSYINSECMRLSHLSGKMMELLELENAFSPNIEAFRADELLLRVKNTCKVVADDRRVELLTRPSGIILKTDRELLTDVLINLTDNAVKASPANEQVLLYFEDGCIVVEDHGCGIPEEELDKITEPFYTVDRSRCRKNGGAGLGLALAGLIVEKLGMELKIESTVGKGTKITIYNLMTS